MSNVFQKLAGLAALLVAGPVLAQEAPVPADAALILRGQYVARLGDCAACHTAVNGASYAGGLRIKSPVGTIYSTDITPDPVNGIGKYSLEEFGRAVRTGVRKDGATLYPAMPYPEFSRMSDADIAALCAYFMHGVAPVAQADHAEDIPWPLSIRWFVGVWRWLFAPAPVAFAPAAGIDPVLARGEYLVTGPGHCGACHSPRGLAMQELALDASGGPEFLAGGGPIDNWVPVSLRSDGRNGIGNWSEDDLVTFLKTGRTDSAAVFGGMADVVAWSTSQFTDDDLHAVARYLKLLPPVPADSSPGDKLAAAAFDAGKQVYDAQCAICHQGNGAGVARMFPPLAGNPVLLSRDPTSLLNIVLNGATLPPSRRAPSSVQMPAYRDRLTDAQVADVVNYIRQDWGNQAPPNAKPAAAAKLRSLAGTQASLGWMDVGAQPYGQGWTFAPESHAGDTGGR